MTKKNVPERLHLVFRKAEPCDEVGQFYDTPGGGTSKMSLDDADDFVDLGCQSVWEVSNHFVAVLLLLTRLCARVRRNRCLQSQTLRKV